MENTARILELRSQIHSLEAELETLQATYMAEAVSNGILSEEIGEYKFMIQPNPPRLDVDKKLVPGQFYKPAVDTTAVRKYLLEYGKQPWGALCDEKPYKLVIKSIALKE